MTQQQQSGDETKIPSMIDKAITCLTEKGTSISMTQFIKSF